jgi:hypothetical protein
MLAVLLVGSAMLVEREPAHPALAGFASTFAAAIKVFPLFIVGYHALTAPARVWRGILAAIVLSFFIPFLVYGIPEGIGLFRGFIAGLFTYAADNSLTKTPDILCLPSFLARWISPGTEPGPGTRWVIKGAIGAFSATFFALVLWRKRKGFEGRERLHLWSLGLALMVFLNPSTRPHYFIFLLPAMASAFELASALRGSVERRVFAATMASALLFIAFTAEGVVGKALNDRLEQLGVPTIGMFLLCIALLWQLSKAFGYAAAFRVENRKQKLVSVPE